MLGLTSISTGTPALPRAFRLARQPDHDFSVEWLIATRSSRPSSFTSAGRTTWTRHSARRPDPRRNREVDLRVARLGEKESDARSATAPANGTGDRRTSGPGSSAEDFPSHVTTWPETSTNIPRSEPRTKTASADPARPIASAKSRGSRGLSTDRSSPRTSSQRSTATGSSKIHPPPDPDGGANDRQESSRSLPTSARVVRDRARASGHGRSSSRNRAGGRRLARQSIPASASRLGGTVGDRWSTTPGSTPRRTHSRATFKLTKSIRPSPSMSPKAIAREAGIAANHEPPMSRKPPAPPSRPGRRRRPTGFADQHRVGKAVVVEFGHGRGRAVRTGRSTPTHRAGPSAPEPATAGPELPELPG